MDPTLGLLGARTRRTTVRLARWSARPGYRLAFGAYAVVVAATVALAAVATHPDRLVLCSMTLTMFVCVMMTCVLFDLEVGRPLWSGLPLSVAASTWVASVYVVSGLLGAWGFLLLLVLVGTSPRLLARLAAWCGTDAADPGPSVRQLVAREAWRSVEPADALPGPQAPTPEGLPELTTRQLCRLWSATSAELVAGPTPDQRGRLARLRSACLDELWQRDEAGCRRWLQAGALEADPAAYLGGREKTS